MTVYVDEIRDHNGVDNPATRKHGYAWCHMIADSREELDAMAQSIGLKTAYRQHSGKPLEHYDLTPRRREAAISKGAVALTGEQFRRVLAGRIPTSPEALPFQARLNAIRNAATRERAEALCRRWCEADPDRAHLYEAEYAVWWEGKRR